MADATVDLKAKLDVLKSSQKAAPAPAIDLSPEKAEEDAITAAKQVLARAIKSGKAGSVSTFIEEVKDEAEREADKVNNFGPGKEGKKKWSIPPLHPKYGHVTLSAAVEVKNAKGETVKKPNGDPVLFTKTVHYIPGKQFELTYDEIQEIQHRMTRLVQNEMTGRFGEGVAQSVQINTTRAGHNLMRGQGGLESY